MQHWVPILIFLGLAAGFGRAEETRLNVLFLAIDDLRPDLGCYGNSLVVSPNIDRLAGRGMTFTRAYCQEAVCNPSRASLMTGRRPDTIQVWDLQTHFRDALPEVVTMPQYFKARGYHTRSIGKIYHGGGKPAKDLPSWSEPPLYDVSRQADLRYALPENREGKGFKSAATEAAPEEESTYVDSLVCETALEAIDTEAELGRPFFLAVGFRKPHLPFCAPQKYWDLYDREAIPKPVTTQYPEGAPELAVRSWGELEGYSDIPASGEISPAKIQELRHGYYACISYIDALIGRLLDRLEERGLAQNTIVCLWGDHGFHLGEQGLWTKASNYELSTRVPLILTMPQAVHPGTQCEALVELVDVYPTLVEACGLPLPGGLEGTSLCPLLEDPERGWKAAVFSQYPRAKKGSRHEGPGDFMGYAIRTKDYRYVEWREVKSGRVKARELYDLVRDPHEMQNLAGESSYGVILGDLQQQLEAGWEAAVPNL